MTKRKALFAAILGNLIEYYDYTLYGLLATEISQHFFPASSKSIELLQAFAVFALGSMAKPLGAIIFSKIGDGKGRRPALRWNMLGIAIPTFLIGLIPSYASWGILATVLLIICRLLQGFFVGGEADGVRIYIMEHVGKKRYCFAGGLVGLTSYFGIYIASFLSGLILTPALPEGAWRWLFILGGVFGFVVFLLRNHIKETDEYVKAPSHPETPKSFLKLLKKNRAILIATILMTGSGGAVYPFLIIFMNSYLSDILGILTPKQAAIYISYALLAYTVSAPIGGFIADYVAKIQMVVIGKILLTLSTVHLFYQMTDGEMTVIPFISIGLIQGIFSAPIYPILLERIRIKERYRTLSMGHTLGSMILSNTTPFVCMFLWQQTHQMIAPIAYFSGLISLTWVALLFLKKHRA